MAFSVLIGSLSSNSEVIGLVTAQTALHEQYNYCFSKKKWLPKIHLQTHHPLQIIEERIEEILISLILMSFGNRLLNIVASFAFRGIVCALKKHILFL
jgi:prolipoprotein diacylglyceryltransferase